MQTKFKHFKYLDKVHRLRDGKIIDIIKSGLMQMREYPHLKTNLLSY